MKTIKAIHAQTFFEKSKGLLGVTKPYSLFFQTRWGIHTFGMRFPIDIVILREDYTIASLKENLEPNRIFFWNPTYQYILELPSGTIENEKLKRGDKIKLIFL